MGSAREASVRQTAAALSIVAAAGILRFWGAFDLPMKLGDEPFHVPSALNMASFGVPLPMNWTHPPVSALILEASIALFGDDPLGWRVGGIVLGIATVGLLYLVAWRLTRSAGISLGAAALLAVDPFHVYFSRSTFMEVPVLCFFMLFLWGLLAYEESGKGWALPVAGLALGLAAGTKSYFVGSATLAIAWVGWRAWRRARPQERAGLLLTLGCWLGLVPVAVYLASFWQFFAAGNTLAELLQMRVDAFHTLRSLGTDSFDSWWLAAGGAPWEWFVKPIFAGYRFDGRYLLELNTFPLRPLALGALAYLAVLGLRERDARLLAPPLLFASVYVLFLVLHRPMGSYSAVVVLPFAWLGLAWAAGRVGRSLPRLRGLTAAALALAVAWGIYLYPLATGKLVPEGLYGAVLKRATLAELPR